VIVEAIYTPYPTTVHFEPEGTVTTAPLETVIGPADMAFLPEGIM
jgi:hypothetical protein